MNIIKVVLILFLFLPVQSGFGQEVPDKVKSGLEIRHDSLEQKVEDLQETIDKHNVKEDFFDAELTYQTALFTSILGIIIAIATLINWGIVSSKAKSNRQHIDKQVSKIEAEFADYSSEYKDLKIEFYLNTARLFFLHSFVDNRNDFKAVLKSFALKYNYKTVSIYEKNELDQDEDYRLAKSNVDSFLDDLIELLPNIIEQDDLEFINNAGQWDYLYILASYDDEIADKAKNVIVLLNREL